MSRGGLKCLRGKETEGKEWRDALAGEMCASRSANPYSSEFASVGRAFSASTLINLSCKCSITTFTSPLRALTTQKSPCLLSVFVSEYVLCLTVRKGVQLKD